MSKRYTPHILDILEIRTLLPQTSVTKFCGGLKGEEGVGVNCVKTKCEAIQKGKTFGDAPLYYQSNYEIHMFLQLYYVCKVGFAG